jgi:transcriptional regulator with XRE-family HTH domain
VGCFDQVETETLSAVAQSAASRIRMRLKKLRKVHDITQEQFSEISGISYKYYQAVEAGTKIDLRISTLERLARAYCLQLHEFLAPELPPTRLRIEPRDRAKGVR